MLDISFTGIVLKNTDHFKATTNDFITNIDNRQVYYQGYFYSTDPSARPHKWSSIKQSGWRGEIDINLGDDDWLTPTGSAISGDKVILVFWMYDEDRTNPNILTHPRGWVEIVLTGSSSYEIYPMIANTNISYTYSDDMPYRYGVLNHDYNFHYVSEWNKTYELTSFLWYNQITHSYQYTSDTITMSQEDNVYGENIYPVVTDIQEKLTFTSSGEYITRNISDSTTDFTHSFSEYQESRLEKTMKYLVNGSYYNDSLIVIIDRYFVEKRIKEPGNLDITIYKDRDFKLLLNTDRVDFWTFQAEVKETHSSSKVVAEFEIIVDKAEETILLKLDTNTINNLPTTKNKLVWDLKIKNPLGNIYNIIEGTCFLQDTVTRGI